MLIWLIFFYQHFVLAEETLGKFAIEEINLRPYVYVREEQAAGFELGESSMLIGWKLDKLLSSHIRIGPQSLINKPIFYTNETSEDFAIVEAYGLFKGPYGKFRFGLLPVEFGIEGAKHEGQLIFNRSYVFEKRIVGLRDLGMSYFIENKGYFTQLTVHNGEVHHNTDERVFVTSKWGWTDHDNIEVGLSAHTGTTKPISTSEAIGTVAGFQPSEESLLRILDFYVDWHPNAWQLAFEVIAGEIEQDSHQTPFKAGYVDLGYQSTSFFSYVLRLEQFDPNYDVNDDLQKRISIAFNFSDKYKTSMVSLILRKNLEENVDLHNDEAFVVWRISPVLHAVQY